MFVQHPDPRQLFHEKYKGIHLLLQAQCTRDIEAGEQLFTPYGDKFWKDHAPIYRKEIDESKLLEPGVIQEESDIDIDLTGQNEAKEQTPQKRLKNSSTLTQDDDECLITMLSSPLTPLESPSQIDASSLLDSDDKLTPKSLKRKSKADDLSKKQKSLTNLSSFPQALTPPPTKNKRASSKLSSNSSKSSSNSASKSSSKKKPQQQKRQKKIVLSDSDDIPVLPDDEFDPVGLEELEAAKTLWSKFTILWFVTFYF
jgi:hypothetical protein